MLRGTQTVCHIRFLFAILESAGGKFWIGHANKDVTDKYAAQLKEDVEWRKDMAEKTGLGFALSAGVEISIGQLGQPEVVRSEEAKAA